MIRSVITPYAKRFDGTNTNPYCEICNGVAAQLGAMLREVTSLGFLGGKRPELTLVEIIYQQPHYQPILRMECLKAQHRLEFSLQDVREHCKLGRTRGCVECVAEDRTEYYAEYCGVSFKVDGKHFGDTLRTPEALC